METNIHALSGVRIHNLSVWASEDSNYMHYSYINHFLGYLCYKEGGAYFMCVSMHLTVSNIYAEGAAPVLLL
jgi:hypothetical protein